MDDHERTITLKGRPFSRGEASVAIMQAVARSGFSMTAAAAGLGVDYRQLARIVARLGLGAEIDAARIAAGVKVPPRPPRTATGPGARPAGAMSDAALGALAAVSALPADERERVLDAAARVPK